MKVAFTTSNRTYVNTHFGVTKEIDVYEISEKGYDFVKTLTFDGDLEQAAHEDKITPKIEAVSDCKIVYVNAIGKPAGNKLMKMGVMLVRAQPDDKIPDILNMLVQSLNGSVSAPPMLRKALFQEETNLVYSYDE